MKKKVLFVHGAGNQEDGHGSKTLLFYIKKMLGGEYAVLSPQMPDPENPRYEAWRETIHAQLAQMEEPLLLIGHSFGGSILIKYLSEEPLRRSVQGLFLVAAAYWGIEGWEIAEYALEENFEKRFPDIANVYLYHSWGDEWVPFTHVVHYAEKLPKAKVRTLKGTEHTFLEGLPELIEDIKNLEKW